MSAGSSTKCAHDCMHSLKSAISLSWVVCASNLGSLLIVRVRNSVRPIHLFDHNCDHDSYFELPSKGSGMPNHYAGDLLHTMAISGLSRVRTELDELTVVHSLAPHPVQMHCEFARHGYLGNLPPAPHGRVERSTAPLRVAAYRDLRRFYQQKTKQRVALFADVPQSAAIATGLFRRNQPHIAGNLFSAAKPFCSSNHQLEGQRR